MSELQHDLNLWVDAFHQLHDLLVILRHLIRVNTKLTVVRMPPELYVCVFHYE